MKRASQLWLFWASVSLLLLAFDARAITSIGGRSCGVWVRDTSTDSIQRTANRVWLVGYLSGIAAGQNIDVLKGLNPESVFLWVDNYCRSNPLESVASAGQELFNVLARQR